MNKKPIEVQDLDIPKNDIECWERYPKHHWVYDLSRLFDAQNIKWSPFRTPILNHAIFNLRINSENMIALPKDKEPGYIYIQEPMGTKIITEVYLIKGEIKLMRHIDPNTLEEISGIIGEVELRMNAFVTLYFQKFTGVFLTETYKNEIYEMSLKPLSIFHSENNLEVIKLIKKIYKKHDVNEIVNDSKIELLV